MGFMKKIKKAVKKVVKSPHKLTQKIVGSLTGANVMDANLRANQEQMRQEQQQYQSNLLAQENAAQLNAMNQYDGVVNVLDGDSTDNFLNTNRKKKGNISTSASLGF